MRATSSKWSRGHSLAYGKSFKLILYSPHSPTLRTMPCGDRKNKNAEDVEGGFLCSIPNIARCEKR